MSAEGKDYTQLHRLVGRAVEEPEFAARLLDPKERPAALRDVGIDPTPETLHEITHSLNHLRAVYEAFGGDTRLAS